MFLTLLRQDDVTFSDYCHSDQPLTVALNLHLHQASLPLCAVLDGLATSQ